MDEQRPMSVPDDWLYAVVEIDIDSFVRAGVTQFRGSPHLFVSESLDLDQWDTMCVTGEMFYLVPVPPEETLTFLHEHRQLDPHRSRGDYLQACEASWQHWLDFKETWLQAATGIYHVRRDFWQGFDDQLPPNFDPNAGWRFLAVVAPEVMHARFAQLVKLRHDDGDGPTEYDEMVF